MIQETLPNIRESFIDMFFSSDKEGGRLTSCTCPRLDPTETQKVKHQLFLKPGCFTLSRILLFPRVTKSNGYNRIKILVGWVKRIEEHTILKN